MTSLLNIGFIVSIAAYVVGALFYARVQLATAPPLRRLAFIGTLFIIIAIAVSVADDHAWVKTAFTIYVALTVYGWFSSAHEASRRGVMSTGIARALIK